ncbi:unnamed protein product [Thelazia callipaeda]|uniref:Tudor domain-containing protein n=1 Tax=Thelazia callipaeda TaxID=103827 RepID=A0A0N5CPE0_THECL|nr:unnamed protein product [Thelazia callipaeda]
MACHDSDEEVIYKKEDHNDVENEDVWDDSALIKMYDEMVNKTYDSLDYQGTSTKKIKKAQGRKWNVNDHCLAPYYHDQLWYPAIIKRFGGKHSDKCEVLYDVYDELAWVNIEDLIQ